MKNKKYILLGVIVVVLSFFAFNTFFDRSKSISGNSDVITQIPESGNTTSIIMDFLDCSTGRDTVYFGLGSSHFAFEGIEDGKCIFYFGTEIENPNWNGNLNFKCAIPSSLGKQTYEVGDFGISWGDDFESYCKD